MKALIRIGDQQYLFAADDYTETPGGWIRAEGRWRWVHRRVVGRFTEYAYSHRKVMTWPPSSVVSIEGWSE